MKKKWLEKYPVCIGCGRDWETVTHSSKGRCRGCARKAQYKGNGKDKNREVWAKDYDCCQKCGTIEVIHAGGGLCRTCYSNEHRDNNLDHYHAVEADRRALPENKDKQKKHYDRWYEKNKEEHIKNTTEWNQNNRDLCREYEAKYRENNRQACRDAYKRWYDENPEKAAEIGRRNRENNPLLYQLHNQKRRARLAGVENTLTENEWKEIVAEYDYHCYICNHDGSEDGDITLDHVIPLAKEGPHTKENVLPACSSCNSSKGDKDLDVFLKERERRHLLAETKE